MHSEPVSHCISTASRARALVGILWCLAICVTLTGCATGKNPKDPYESFNRGVFKVNESLDTNVLRPVAVGYKKAVPLPVRGGVESFLSNLGDIPNAINNLLQGKFRRAASDTGRVVVNTTIGILGFFDVATRLGLQQHKEDFGQTLGAWGVGPGPYLMLPLLGPSTVRDGTGLIVDIGFDPGSYVITGSGATVGLFSAKVINARTQLLDSDRLLNEAALDKYSFLRDAYLQRRESLVRDGADSPSPTNGAKPRKSLKELEEELDEAEPGDPPAKPPAQ